MVIIWLKVQRNIASMQNRGELELNSRNIREDSMFVCAYSL